MGVILQHLRLSVFSEGDCKEPVPKKLEVDE